MSSCIKYRVKYRYLYLERETGCTHSEMPHGHMYALCIFM